MKKRVRRTRGKKQKKGPLKKRKSGEFGLRNRRNGRHVAKPPDTRLRRLLIPTPGGVREVAIRGSREASRLGKFWAAVQKYLQIGDNSALVSFKGKRFTDASGNRHFFPTDLKQLDRQASAGVLSFESMYAGGGR